MTVADIILTLSTHLKSLGVIFDPKRTFDWHASGVCKACNYHIWTLRNIPTVIPLDVAKTLASSTVSSRLDYWNSVLYSTPNSTTTKLQRVQKYLARAVLQRQKSCNVQPLLESLHLFPVSQQINFKLATLAFKIRSTLNQINFINSFPVSSVAL